MLIQPIYANLFSNDSAFKQFLIISQSCDYTLIGPTLLTFMTDLYLKAQQ